MQPNTASVPIHRLTPRQIQILELLTEGMSQKQIASILSIGTGTVKSHIRRACAKTLLDNRIQLIVAFAVWKATNDNK